MVAILLLLDDRLDISRWLGLSVLLLVFLRELLIILMSVSIKRIPQLDLIIIDEVMDPSHCCLRLLKP
jgi:hypothetical protein